MQLSRREKLTSQFPAASRRVMEGDTVKPYALQGWWASVLACCLWASPLSAQELGQEGYVDSNGVKIHYVTLGAGPLVVMLHGFPDYWYTWRDQMPVLAKRYQVVAIDLRGFNKSD